MTNKEEKNPTSKDKESKTSSQKKRQSVEFTFYAPEAKEVYLVGEFNNWNTQSLPTKKDKDGVWKTEIKLFPGRYEYKFFADNTWVENIPGVELVSNLFGTQNCVIWVK